MKIKKDLPLQWSPINQNLDQSKGKNNMFNIFLCSQSKTCTDSLYMEKCN